MWWLLLWTIGNREPSRKCVLQNPPSESTLYGKRGSGTKTWCQLLSVVRRCPWESQPSIRNFCGLNVSLIFFSSSDQEITMRRDLLADNIQINVWPQAVSSKRRSDFPELLQASMYMRSSYWCDFHKKKVDHGHLLLPHKSILYSYTSPKLFTI